MDYIWGPLDAPYYKLAYVIGVKVDGTKYFIGSGFTMIPDAQHKAARCATCSADVAMPCALKNSTILASSALAKSLTDIPTNSTWSLLTSDANYNANDGFYVFAFNYDGTCVAHLFQ